MKGQILNLFSAIFIILSINTTKGIAQNLVKNPSFDNYVYCPFGVIQVDACVDWMNFGMSPDYFHACATNGMNVPNTAFGFQYAHTGPGMCGVVTYPGPSTIANYREFIGSELVQPTVIGQKYYLSFYANFAYYPTIQAVASNNIGLKLSSVPYDSANPPPVNNISHLHVDSILSDSVNWIRVSGSFIADSIYNYIVIGNFYADSLTDTLHLAPYQYNSYYFIDDVCVSTDSIYNETWTSINETQPDNPAIYYDHKTQSIILSDSKGYMAIEIFNAVGQKVYSSDLSFFDNTNSINIPQLSQGVYLIRFSNKNQTVTFRIFIN